MMQIRGKRCTSGGRGTVQKAEVQIRGLTFNSNARAEEQRTEVMIREQIRKMQTNKCMKLKCHGQWPLATQFEIMPIADTNCFKVLKTCLFLSTDTTTTTITVVTSVPTVYMFSLLP